MDLVREGWAPARAAQWLADAVETGDPLAPLPIDIAPRDVTEGEHVAAAVLEALGLVPCGLRLLRRGADPALAGPMLEARLLKSGSAVALAALRHPVVTAAAVGVLAEDLVEAEEGPPRLAALHPALDIATTRFTNPPEDPALLTADLAQLGLLVTGRRKAMEAATVKVALGQKGARQRGAEVDLAAAFAEAASAARRLGGLPAGALLVVAGLTPAIPAGEGVLVASLGTLGRVEAVFS